MTDPSASPEPGFGVLGDACGRIASASTIEAAVDATFSALSGDVGFVDREADGLLTLRACRGPDPAVWRAAVAAYGWPAWRPGVAHAATLPGIGSVTVFPLWRDADPLGALIVGRPDDAARVLAGVLAAALARLRAEDDLASLRRELSMVLDGVTDGVLVHHADGRILHGNAEAARLLGYGSLERLHAARLSEFPAMQDDSGRPIALEQAPIFLALRGQESRAVLGVAGLRVGMHARPLLRGDGSVRLAVTVLEDVTRKRRDEEERARASTLESIGMLAGGIAHDFNNILTSVVANLSLVEDGLDEEHEAWPRLAAAGEACDRARDLARQLLTFARGGEPRKAATPVDALLHQACAQSLARSRAVIEMGPGVDAIVADATQVGQGLRSVLTNAEEAMPSGGIVRVSADNVDVVFGAELPLAPGRYVRITVADEGDGIPPDLRPRIFDPFVTTKPGRSGLGLAITWSIVRRHRGHVAVESEVGSGARFTFHLPRADVPAVAARPPATGAVPRGEGRILVLDDDPSIRTLTRRCLETLGYSVDTCANGTEAVAAWGRAAEGGRPFALAILDLTIPGGPGGAAAIRQILEIDPRARAVVSSGYSNDPIVANPAAYGFVGVIQKPYDRDELGRVVAGAIG